MQILRRRISVSIRKGSEINLQGEQYLFHRLFTYQELLCHALQNGFSVVARYDDLATQVDAFKHEVRRVVVVLQKPIRDS